MSFSRGLAAPFQDRLPRVGAQDAIVHNSFYIPDFDGRLIWRRAVLDPHSKLVEKTRRLSASSSSTVAHSGYLEVAIEAVDVREERRDFVVVHSSALRGKELIDLSRRQRLLLAS